MNNTELLKEARNMLLGLHKSLVDFDRSSYEEINGPTTGGQFLNILLEDEEFGWLRKFSTLIVEIDEMFAQRDGFQAEAVDAQLSKMRDLVAMKDGDENFAARYRSALQQDPDAAGKQGELKTLLALT